MTDPLQGVLDATSSIARTWVAGARVPLDQLDGIDLLDLNAALGVLRRNTDAVHAAVASEIARRSRAEFGPDGLAKKNGFRSPAILIATTTGTSTSEAARLLTIGEGTAPRARFDGDPAPARHPHVARAIAAGGIGADAASAVIRMLDRLPASVPQQAKDAAEATLCRQATGLPSDQFAKIVAQAEARLAPDELERSHQQLRAQRSLTMFERAGMLHVTAKLDVATGAPVKAAIEALVTAQFRAGAAHNAVDDASDDPDAAHLSVAQRQADALMLLATHALGCEAPDLPMQGATVIVRMTLEDLQSGTGTAAIDGIAQPIPVRAARVLAAGGGIIPCVLGSRSEILDWGREKRLFTRSQRLVLAERDGGCAMCGLPPGMTKAHHIAWYVRDGGATDVNNGVLLCESCHHRIHDNGWEIRIEGADPPTMSPPGRQGQRTKRPFQTAARVWFIPPPHIDPQQTPRLGGRARFDYAA